MLELLPQPHKKTKHANSVILDTTFMGNLS
jgi:hypothetical protein